MNKRNCHAGNFFFCACKTFHSFDFFSSFIKSSIHICTICTLGLFVILTFFFFFLLYFFLSFYYYSFFFVLVCRVRKLKIFKKYLNKRVEVVKGEKVTKIFQSSFLQNFNMYLSIQILLLIRGVCKLVLENFYKSSKRISSMRVLIMLNSSNIIKLKQLQLKKILNDLIYLFYVRQSYRIMNKAHQ